MAPPDDTLASQVAARLAHPGGWRSEMLAHLRGLIHQVDPEVVEEVKWIKPTNPVGVFTWSHGGLVCTGETYRDKVKLTFARGSAVADPAGLFNASLEGVRRAIDIGEGQPLDPAAFQALFRAAVAVNLANKAPRSK